MYFIHGINNKYKYIISPDYNEEGEDLDLLNGYMPLTKEIYAQYILGKGREQLSGYDQYYLGDMFEKVFIDWARLNIGPSVQKNTTNYSGTVPDATSPLLYENNYSRAVFFTKLKIPLEILVLQQLR